MAILRTKNGNVLMATFFLNHVEGWHKTGTHSWTFTAQEDIFFFFLFSCGQFDLWSTSRFCWALLVSWGLQVKPQFHQNRRRWTKATLRSWLNDKTSYFYSFSDKPRFLLDLQRNIALCFFYCNCFSCGVSLAHKSAFLSWDLTLEMRNLYCITAFAIL